MGLPKVGESEDAVWENAWWAPIVHFAAHTLVGTAIFIIIGLPAICLALGIKWLAAHGVPEFPVTVLNYVEEILCLIDATLYVVYILIASYHALKEFLR